MASQQLLDGDHLVDNDANVTFLSACQYRYGGIAKEPGETSGKFSDLRIIAAPGHLGRACRDPLKQC